ncbi:thioesterase domain-containing protein [Lachnospiraceae bacterium 54-53]
MSEDLACKKRRLIKGLDKTEDGHPVMFCFPYAGGGASVYGGWERALKGLADVCPIQLPGREERIMEEPYTEMSGLINDLMECMAPYIRRDMILFGHSMGAKMAFEMAGQLEQAGVFLKHLILSGSRVPDSPEPRPIYHLSDEEFKREIGRFDGTPAEILENRELLDFFLPMLRADFTLDETYYQREMRALSCPITAFCGMQDEEAGPAAVLKWEELTGGKFECHMYGGGHFFIREHTGEILAVIKEIIRGIRQG